MCFDTNKYVNEILSKGSDHVQFGRTLYGDSLDLGNHIKEACVGVVLTEQRDLIKWTLNKYCVYSVKSYYRYFVEMGLNFHITSCEK